MTVVRGLDEELTNEFEEVRPPTLRSVVSCNGPRRTSNFTFRAPQENFTIDDFELGPVLGVGSFSKVVRVKKKDTGNVYALKIMDKDFITKQHKVSHVKQERIVLDQLNHPGIVQLLFTFQDSYSLYMAFEACEGGELFDQITRKGRIFEDEARFYIAEIIDVLEYLHGIGLIHRDIKPENLLLTANGHVKVADFGSVKVTEGTRILLPPLAASETTGSFEGTAAYVPPEVLNTSTTTIANDHWALGCTLYQMLSGTSPFQDSSEWLMFKKIKSRDIKFPVYFSDEAIDLIDNLLDMDPGRRLGVGPGGYPALKMHPFFKGIEWSKLREMSAPKIALDSNDSTGESKKSNSDVALYKTSASGFGSNTTPSLEFHSVFLASVDSFDSRWQEFLEPGESIVLASKLKKLRLLTSKKVQLILTNKPRLFYVNPSKSMENMKIIWSDNPNGISVQVLNPSHFKVCTPMKLSSFEDKKQLAWHWKRAIEGLANH
ncbi:3-phosphoinositide-dependent protein kinase 2 [Dendrobium catenatum]|uniref:3-phosphoinositide-dependent protein kinase 2 n=1 Tax=Dendrobium catenatum TaxID=906689 RepID=UPI0009F1EFAC|nr:3-phosphoinositide-dependent protein kinase 2 [Dendrobium catenatum]XP_020681168.1 3-phosphoinositide-dependent protein kinase 2 [Dendrobium catenatum]